MNTAPADAAPEAAPGPPEEKTARRSEEWTKGAQTADTLTTRAVEAGHSADHIAAMHEQALGDREGGDWEAGYRETAAHETQELREMADREAEDLQAARDEADAIGGARGGDERDRDAEAERDEPEAGS
jgi:hypothetical protein